MTDEVKLNLTQDEALVLLEFLTRFSDQQTLKIEHQAEARTLWNLQCILESALTEPLQSNYAELLESARHKVEDKETG